MSNLFREKSMERISSPEQLNAYIRVSTPSVWMVLSAVIVLLVGVCVWGMFGHLDTTLTVAAVCDGETATAYVREADAAQELYGDARLQALLDRHAGEAVSEICAAVKADVDAFVGEAEQFDDMTMLCLTYNGVQGATEENA